MWNGFTTTFLFVAKYTSKFGNILHSYLGENCINFQQVIEV